MLHVLNGSLDISAEPSGQGHTGLREAKYGFQGATSFVDQEQLYAYYRGSIFTISIRIPVLRHDSLDYHQVFMPAVCHLWNAFIHSL